MHPSHVTDDAEDDGNDVLMDMVQQPVIQNNEDFNRMTSDCSGMAREEWSQHLKANVTCTLERRNSSLQPCMRRFMSNVEFPGQLAMFVESNMFQTASATTIVLNALVIGYSSNVGMGNVLQQPPASEPAWIEYYNIPFTVIYAIELLFRILAHRWRFVTGPDWKWNSFDVAMLVMSLGEEIVRDMGSASLRVLRGLRMFRVLRMIRVLRFFRDLRMMVCSILQSLGALSWALLLLLIIMYLFTVFFMQGAIMYMYDNPDSLLRSGVAAWYGSVFTAMYTMLAAITGGIDWTDAVEPLEDISTLYQVLWVFYIVFVVIGVLNVLTGIFVERACELSGLDKDLVIQAEIRRSESFLVEMKRIFQEADADHSGKMSWPEFRNYMQNPRMRAYFATKQLDAYDARTFFDMMRDEGSEEVDLQTFMLGCLRMKGMAKSVDLLAVLRETRETKRTLKDLVRKLGDGTESVPSRKPTLTTMRRKSWQA